VPIAALSCNVLNPQAHLRSIEERQKIA
jgi:hypothetical protein